MLKHKLIILLNINKDRIILEKKNNHGGKTKEIKLNKENFKIN